VQALLEAVPNLPLLETVDSGLFASFQQFTSAAVPNNGMQALLEAVPNLSLLETVDSEKLANKLDSTGGAGELCGLGAGLVQLLGRAIKLGITGPVRPSCPPRSKCPARPATAAPCSCGAGAAAAGCVCAGQHERGGKQVWRVAAGWFQLYGD